MGKGNKSKGNDGQKGSKQGKISAKCSCDHPFQCSCGNRPERPSKGHKWNPETQQWGGKGHKQKGASGQVASVSQQAKVTESSTVVAQWQRLPTQILQEYCQRQKRPLPVYKELKHKKETKFRVILKDPKKNETKDLIFIPKHTVANGEQAKQEAALLALLQVTPDIPHERKLPEPYKTTWLNAVTKKTVAVNMEDHDDNPAKEPSEIASAKVAKVAKASHTLELANSFVSQAEREKQKALENASRQQRQRQRENIRQANKDHTVLLSSEFRHQIEQLLRQHDDDDASETIIPLHPNVRTQLSQAGFSEFQIDMARGASFEECVQYLMVRLPEDELPEAYDPRGQTLDVVVAPGVNISTLSEYGISKPEASRVLKVLRGCDNGDDLRNILYSLLCNLAGYKVTPVEPTDEQRSMAMELFQEEVEALRAIYDTDVTIEELEDGLAQIVIADRVELLLRKGWYPVTARFERVLIRQASTSLHVAVLEELQNLPLGEIMVFSIYATIQELFEQMESLPKRSLLDCITADDPLKPVPTRHSKDGAKPNPARPSRPRVRTLSFWTIPPNKTQPAGPPSASMATIRQQLPAATSRGDFLSTVRNHRVVLVTGETGSGKSTQLPAFILEDQPDSSKIVVAQPRRLAATGVASRVAQERGEPIGKTVGYVVRGDTAMNDQCTRLVFCTTGILLRQLQNESALENITHIVIDEVHERHLDSDVLLGILKERLDEYPKLHVILMSATLDTEKFTQYWGVLPPHLHIPGRTFPVQDHLLEDVLKLTGYIPRKQNRKKSSPNTNRWVESDQSEGEEVYNNGGDDDFVSSHGISMADLLDRMDETTVDYDLLSTLICHLVKHRPADDDGSILVFLAGVPEITKGIEAVRNACRGLSVTLLPLHGGLQPKEQNAVFRKPEAGRTKIILSTNVAETSVTIPDCTIVIDTCREKQSSYDPVNRMPLLVEQFASKASLKQRRGRAGRVREGTCYKLITQRTFHKLSGHAEPEIRRVALDQTLLQLMFLEIEDGSGNFMKQLLDPPQQSSLDAAVFSLEKLGAVRSGVDSDRRVLTPLGLHLAAIPSPPIVGKLIVMGSILGCQRAALAMAAGISAGRSPFLRVEKPWRHRNAELTEKEEIEDRRIDRILKERADLAQKVGKSDHALLAAISMKWKKSNSGERKKYCDSLGLSYTGMCDIQQLYNQLEASLASAGFPATAESERNADSWRIIHTCAISAMAPSQLVKVRRPAVKYHETAEGAMERNGEARELKFFIRVDNAVSSNNTAQEERVFLHPSSANFSQGKYSCPFLVYNSLVRTSKPFLRDVTECSAYALLLFGGSLDVQATKGTIVIDAWVRLSANARIGALILGLRRRLDAMLEDKVSNPQIDIASTVEMKIIANLIRTDGLGVNMKL